MSDETVAIVLEAKRQLRADMRVLRSNLMDRPERSARIADRLMARTEIATAHRVMAYTSLSSEPDTSDLLARLAAAGQETAVPEDDVDPAWPDAVIVPGLAFTESGLRCGQGGGWYDRFLPQLRADCAVIAVCFEPQIVADLPVEAHDVLMHAVVTD